MYSSLFYRGNGIIKVYAEKYAEDQEEFFKDYAEAHAKLSDLGAKFDPPEASSLKIIYLYFKTVLNILLIN